MIGQEASIGKRRGIIVGYVEWGEKLQVKYVWIKFDNVISDLIKVKNVTIYK